MRARLARRQKKGGPRPPSKNRRLVCSVAVAAPAAEAAASAAAAAGGLGASFVDGQRASAVLLAREGRDGVLRLVVVSELDEAETLDRPVSRSVMTATDSTLPYWAKSVRRSSSVVV